MKSKGLSESTESEILTEKAIQAVVEMENYGRNSAYHIAKHTMIMHGAAGLIPSIWEAETALISVNRYTQQSTKTTDIRRYICPALETISDDAFEITKAITPILVTLNATGVISLQLNAILVASIALVVARMGISSVCADLDKEVDDKHNHHKTSLSEKRHQRKKVKSD